MESGQLTLRELFEVVEECVIARDLREDFTAQQFNLPEFFLFNGVGLNAFARGFSFSRVGERYADGCFDVAPVRGRGNARPASVKRERGGVEMLFNVGLSAQHTCLMVESDDGGVVLW